VVFVLKRSSVLDPHQEW